MVFPPAPLRIVVVFIVIEPVVLNEMVPVPERVALNALDTEKVPVPFITTLELFAMFIPMLNVPKLPAQYSVLLLTVTVLPTAPVV